VARPSVASGVSEHAANRHDSRRSRYCACLLLRRSIHSSGSSESNPELRLLGRQP